MACALALLAGACGGRDSAADTSAAGRPPVVASGIAGQPAATPAMPTTGAGCPANGQWAPCSAIKRLEAAGLVPRRDSSGGSDVVRVAGIPGEGTRFVVGDAELDLFFFPDSMARRSAAAQLDRAAYVRYDQPQTMKQEPTLIESVNLLAILHSLRDQQRERVADALTAGPPQPDPSKH